MDFINNDNKPVEGEYPQPLLIFLNYKNEKVIYVCPSCMFYEILDINYHRIYKHIKCSKCNQMMKII